MFQYRITQHQRKDRASERQRSAITLDHKDSWFSKCQPMKIHVNAYDITDSIPPLTISAAEIKDQIQSSDLPLERQRINDSYRWITPNGFGLSMSPPETRQTTRFLLLEVRTVSVMIRVEPMVPTPSKLLLIYFGAFCNAIQSSMRWDRYLIVLTGKLSRNLAPFFG